MVAVMTPLRIDVVGVSDELVERLTEELRRHEFDPVLRAAPHDFAAGADGREDPDVILVSDQTLELTCVEVISGLAGDHASPVIVVCSPDREADAVEAMKAGARDYVLSNNLARLGPAVRRELAQTRLRREREQAIAALAESEERFRTVVNDQTDFVVRWKPDGTFILVNRAFREYYGGSPESFVGTNIVDNEFPVDQKTIDSMVGRLTPKNPVVVNEPRMILPDGRRVIHEWASRGFFDDRGRLAEIQSVGRDVTEHRRAEEAERQQTLLVEVLRDTAAALNSTLDLDEVFDRILANMGWVIPHNASAIFFAEGGAARVVRLRGWEDQGINSIPGTVPLSEVEVAALTGMMASGRPIVIQNTGDDPRWAPSTSRLDWVRSFAAAPLFDESKLFGVLALFCDRPDYFTDVHIELLEGFASQAASASRNARLFEVVSKSRRELRNLSARIVDAQEEERRRISRELHDGVAQTLTGVIINIELLISEALARGEDPLPPRLQEIAVLSKQSLQQIRDLSHRLRPAILDELGLESTLHWFTGRFAAWSGIAIDLSAPETGHHRLDSATETALYRVVQESLAGIERHGHTAEVSIKLVRRPDRTRLLIESRPSPDAASEPTVADDWSEIDLLGIQERILSLGGELAIDSPGSLELTIDIWVPAAQPAD